MARPAWKSDWFGYCLVLLLVLAASFTMAQDATPPPPPDNAQSSLQQPAPETDVRAVRLSSVYGSVQVLDNGEVDFKQAELNMPIVQGMKIVTAADGRVEIQFEDGSVARVTPNSSITFTQLSRDGDGNTITVIEADSGLTYYELNGRAGQYTVQFAQDKITPIDSAIFRLDLDRAPAELAVTHGSVHASNDADLDVDAHTNQTLQFDPSHPNEYQLLESVAANTWDQWNSDRDEALAQIDQNATEASAETGSPDNPAWSDLDASGDWYDVPGYGMGWSPSGVGEGWDPYGAGSWGYYNNIGYTWISPYSWGWWPYHCGAWSWFDGFGWMWFPGNCGFGGVGFGGGWCPYGTIWSVPPGYNSPRRPMPILPHNGPIRNPKHGPVPINPIIAVHRGPQSTQQFASIPNAKAPKPGPRILQYDGQNIAPLQHQRGNTGEGFTSTQQRAYPGSFVRPAYRVYGPGTSQPVNRPGTVYRPGAVYRPGTVYAPAQRPIGGMRVPPPQPMHNTAPVFRAPSAPVYHPSAPPPAFHAPAPVPAYHAPAAAPAGHPR